MDAATKKILDDLKAKEAPPNDAAVIIGPAPQTLARWRCQGDGPPFIRLGRRSFPRLRT